MRLWFMDYAAHFGALSIMLKSEEGREMMRKDFENGYKIPTVEEYLKQCRDEAGAGAIRFDENDSLFTERAKELNGLANKINSLGKEVDEETINEVTAEVSKIVNG